MWGGGDDVKLTLTNQPRLTMVDPMLLPGPSLSLSLDVGGRSVALYLPSSTLVLIACSTKARGYLLTEEQDASRLICEPGLKPHM